MVNKREIGKVYEKRAGAYLEQHGYKVIEYNFQSRQGEIDIIAKDGEYLVFVEVKYRTDSHAGNPFEAVNRSKQRTISKVASYYCLTHGYGVDTPCRFDVLAIDAQSIQLYKNAFEACMR